LSTGSPFRSAARDVVNPECAAGSERVPAGLCDGGELSKADAIIRVLDARVRSCL
jgi:hypothetical protein